jgi:hypothetical protein
MMTRETDW